MTYWTYMQWGQHSITAGTVFFALFCIGKERNVISGRMF